MISSQKKAKLTWHCRRGMLELDIMLTRFMDRHVDTLTDEQIVAFEHLLGHADPVLYVWLVGQDSPEDKELADIVAFIRLRHNV